MFIGFSRKPIKNVAVRIYNAVTVYAKIVIGFIAVTSRFIAGFIFFFTECVLICLGEKVFNCIAIGVCCLGTIIAIVVSVFIPAATRSVVGIIHFTCRHMRSCREFDGFKHIAIFVQIAVAIRAMVIGDIAGVGTGRLLRFYEFLVFVCARV